MNYILKQIRFKNTVALIFFLAGVVIFLFMFFKETPESPNYIGHLDTQNHIIKNNLISEYVINTQYDALALFVVSNEFCSSCLNEIIEYSSEVVDYINSPLNKTPIFPHTLIVGKDSSDFKRVNHLIEFPFSSSFIKKDSYFAKKLNDWKQDVSGINQIVLIDLKRNEVVGRIGIFTSSTSLHFKKNLVQEAFFELEKQP